MCNALYPSPCFYKADSPFQLMLLANIYGNKNVAGIVERKNNCFIAQLNNYWCQIFGRHKDIFMFSGIKKVK